MTFECIPNTPLGKAGKDVINIDLILLECVCIISDAEEAQSKIEELRDQEYNERRSAILT